MRPKGDDGVSLAGLVVGGLLVRRGVGIVGEFLANVHSVRSGRSPPHRHTCLLPGAVIPRSDVTTRRSPPSVLGRHLKDPSFNKQPQQNLLRTQKINPTFGGEKS